MGNKFEQLALWYLRLNGYLTVSNFVLHPDTPGSERTDADLLAVRLPYSREVAGTTMERDDTLVRQDERIDFIIAEVKSGRCRLNGPWIKPETQNMQYVLRWFGMIKEESVVQEVARKLYENCIYEGEDWGLRLACFGSRRSERLHHNVVQITHEEAVKFMSDRFRRHADIKTSHRQWDDFVQKFYRMAVQDCLPTPEILKWLSAPADR